MFFAVNCNFDSAEHRGTCDGGCTAGAAAATGTINFLLASDGSSSGCPINFNVFEFNMTAFGGLSNKKYVSAEALATDLKTSTGKTWTYDTNTCLFTTTDEGAQDYSIPLAVPNVYIDFSFQETGAVSDCPLPFASRTFDLSVFPSGQNDETFIDVAGLESRIETLSGKQWEYDNTTCLFVSADQGATSTTIPLTKKGCDPSFSLGYMIESWQSFVLTSINSATSPSDWKVDIKNTVALEDDSNTMTPAGTTIGTYSAGSYVNTGDLTLSDSLALLNGDFELLYEDDTCQYREVIEIETVAPFVKLEDSTIVNSCSQNSGSSSKSGVVDVISAPLVTDSSTYEQSVQYSLDGVTWLNPDSFAGGISKYAATNPQVDSSQVIVSSPQEGAYLRNCLNAVGVPAPEVCDTKQIPNPQISIDRAGGNVSFSNSTSETNACYKPELEEYQATLRAYDDNGILLEEFETPAWTPFNSNLDLSSAPTHLKAMLTNGADGYTLTFNPAGSPSATRVEASLTVKQNYDCAGSNRDTSLHWTVDSYEYEFDVDSAMVQGTSLRVNTSLITPAVSDFIVHVYENLSGTPKLSYANGNAYIAGTHFPAGPLIKDKLSAALVTVGRDSTYPLPPLAGGKYHLVLETSSGDKVPLGPLCVDDWGLCERSVKAEYEGWALDAGLNYQIPVPGSLDKLQSQFTSLTVPDQVVVKDCAGAIIYDSGMVSVSSPADVETPLSGNDLSCGMLDVTMTSGGAANQITIYDLNLGCCQTGSCPYTLPLLDPYIQNLSESTTTCSWIAQTTMRYCTGGSSCTVNTRCFNFDLRDDQPQSCLFTNDSLGSHTTTYLSQSCTRDRLRVTTCVNFSDPAERTHSVSGAIVTIDFTSVAEYNDGVSFFAQLDSEIPATIGNDLHIINLYHQTYKGSACVDDSTPISGHINLYYKKNMAVFDPGNTRIVLDFTGLYPVDPSNCCIDVTRSDADLAANWDISNLQALYSTSNRLYRQPFNKYLRGFTGALSSSGSKASLEKNFGIADSVCANNSPQMPYTIVVDDVNDFSNTWKLIRGDEATGVVLNAADGSGLVGSGIAAMSGYPSGSIGNNCLWTIEVNNEFGLPRQATDYSTVTCDLSYYGGGGSEVLVDGNDLANRLISLTGGTLAGLVYVNHYDVMRWTSNHPTNLPAVVCK